jgi:uncharacterized protein YjbI with pentapeptide repeats
MPPRRKPVTAALRKPAYFPEANVAENWDAAKLLSHGDEFEEFRFVNCDFSGARLANLRFTDCLFENCNLASATLTNTALQNVAFAGCKLLGVPFGACRDMLFGVHFDHCQLRYASFAGKKMPQTRFTNCDLPEADFTNADLSGVTFDACNLERTVFHNTQLTGADLTTATGYTLDPEANAVQNARFALSGLPGLLSKYGVVVE